MRFAVSLCLLMLTAALALACAEPAIRPAIRAPGVPTYTPLPTARTWPTHTPAPTSTPWPSATPTPTAVPTATPVPTATAVPTPTPGGPPTPTPVYNLHLWRKVNVSWDYGFQGLTHDRGIPRSTPAEPGIAGIINLGVSGIYFDPKVGYVLTPGKCAPSGRIRDCRRKLIDHPDGKSQVQLFIPDNHRVDLGNGEWIDNCENENCRQVPLPDFSIEDDIYADR